MSALVVFVLFVSPLLVVMSLVAGELWARWAIRSLRIDRSKEPKMIDLRGRGKR